MPKFPPPCFISIFFAVILSCFSTLTAAKVLPKIVGGEASSRNQWPWMAGIVKKNLPAFDGIFCGASLIDKQWVLTAGHCVIGENAATIDVIINRAQLNTNNGERLSVERIVLHPFYNDNTLINDLALVKLSAPSIHTPIKVLSSYSPQDNAETPAVALGWGTTSATKSIYPTNLQQVDLSIISNTQCSRTLSGVTTNMLCAGDFSATKDTCSGDSGGPLIVFDTDRQSWKQAGITSWGNGCAKSGFYGVYTRIKKYSSFISDTICSANESPIPPSLTLNVDGNIATAQWGAPNNVYSYHLNYAPFPQAHPINSIDLGQSTQFSAELSPGNAFYVAITRNSGYCMSDFSNIEHFTIK